MNISHEVKFFWLTLSKPFNSLLKNPNIGYWNPKIKKISNPEILKPLGRWWKTVETQNFCESSNQVIQYMFAPPLLNAFNHRKLSWVFDSNSVTCFPKKFHPKANSGSKSHTFCQEKINFSSLQWGKSKSLKIQNYTKSVLKSLTKNFRNFHFLAIATNSWYFWIVLETFIRGQ